MVNPNAHALLSNDEDGKKPITFGGDQLMAARARCAREARMNSDTVLGCLDGLLPVAEDWHTSVVLLNVVLQLFF